MAETKFQKQTLEAHNKLRSHHGAGPLTLNRDMCAIAQRWAQKLAAANCLQHSSPAERQYKGGQMGENIAMKHDSRMKSYGGASVTKQWYDEIKDYDFRSHRGRGVVGHFTQVVWKDSKELGIGRAQSPSGAWYVCANYYPAGNYIGREAYNVQGASNGRALEIESDDEMADNAHMGGTLHFDGFGGWGGQFSRAPMGGDRIPMGGDRIPMGGDRNTHTAQGRTGGNSSKMTDQKFQKQTLEAHNKLRSHHGAGPLTLNRDMCAIAQRWAEKLAAANCLQHSSPAERQYKGGQMGENIAMKHDSRMKSYGGASVTKQWYDEIKDYDFRSHRGRGVVGHFTQVVWKDSKELGIGRAQSPSGAWYVCANYYPAGNYIGRNAYNVQGASNGRALEIESDDEMDDNAHVGGAAGFGGIGGWESQFSRIPMDGGWNTHIVQGRTELVDMGGAGVIDGFGGWGGQPSRRPLGGGWNSYNTGQADDMGMGGTRGFAGFGSWGGQLSRTTMGADSRGGVSISRSTMTKTATDSRGRRVTVKVTTETRTEADGSSTTTETEEIL